MAKEKTYPVVEFTEDYAGKKKGETLTCGRQLANDLVKAGKAVYLAEKPAAKPGKQADKPKPVKETISKISKSKKNEKDT